MADNRIKSGICRNSARHIEWAKLVKERDGECKNCGTKEYLHAHHIIPWKINISKRFDLENGLTLCRSCHKKVEGDCPKGWNKGKSLSNEHRNNLSKSLKGREVWNKGLKGLIVSPETQFKKGFIPWNKGKIFINPEKKTCKMCGIEKIITDFTPMQKGKYYSYKCKKCRNIKGK